MKVKSFWAYNEYQLEGLINSFAKKVEIIDIKYAVDSGILDSRYTALVMYKCKGKENDSIMV